MELLRKCSICAVAECQFFIGNLHLPLTVILHHIVFFRYTLNKALLGNWLFAFFRVTSKNLVAFAIESELSRRSRQIFRKPKSFQSLAEENNVMHQSRGSMMLHEKNCKTSPKIRRWRKLRTTLGLCAVGILTNCQPGTEAKYKTNVEVWIKRSFEILQPKPMPGFIKMLIVLSSAPIAQNPML